ncbi:MAG: M23 family metallopeptidase [Rhodobacterales bacterium]|nr:M23 family metallopeptidase [Rhodobacterales bacterium]
MITWAMAASPALADAPDLSLPIDCLLGDTCYIQNYVDRDATRNSADFTCSGLTYDGHKGTDIGLPSLAAMHAGVDVLASANGVVTGTRNTMRDVIYTPETASQIDGRECGNGVVIRHDDGWETQYCHMMQGSITVAKGMRIERGTVLGQVGLSGLTQFPHVHISVRHNGRIIDPFDTSTRATCAQNDNVSLWQETPEYIAGGLLSAGFSQSIPAYDAIKSGTANAGEFTPLSPAIVFWGFAFGGKTGDQIQITITGPSGTIIDQTSKITKNRAQFFRAAGKKRPSAGWPVGPYTGTVRHLRDGVELGQKTTTITLN